MTNPTSPPDVQQLLRATVLGILDDEALGRIDQVARIEHFQMPTLLSAAGQHPQYLRLVVEGHIETVARNANGEEFVFSYITPGGWATWLSCFMEQAPDHDFYSSSSACFIAIPIGAVQSLCERNPKIYPLLIQEIGRRMRLLMEWTGQSVLVGPVQRMAKLLHLLARGQQGTGNSTTLSMTQPPPPRVATRPSMLQVELLKQIQLLTLRWQASMRAANVLDQFLDIRVFGVNKRTLVSSWQKTRLPILSIFDRITTGTHRNEAG